MEQVKRFRILLQLLFKPKSWKLERGEKVLEIGTGCGYQTAVLLEMGAKVFSVERQKELFDKTKVFLAPAWAIKELS